MNHSCLTTQKIKPPKSCAVNQWSEYEAKQTAQADTRQIICIFSIQFIDTNSIKMLLIFHSKNSSSWLREKVSKVMNTTFETKQNETNNHKTYERKQHTRPNMNKEVCWILLQIRKFIFSHHGSSNLVIHL